MTDPKRAQHADRGPGRPTDATLGPLIVDAVLDLLAEAGYARLTLGAVATRAGCPRPPSTGAGPPSAS